MSEPTIKIELSKPEIRIDSEGPRTSLEIGALSELPAAQRLAEINSDLDFFESLEGRRGSRTFDLIGLDAVSQPGATGLAGRRMPEFSFVDPDATVVMGRDQLNGLLAQMNGRDTLVYVPNQLDPLLANMLGTSALQPPQLPVFGIGDQRIPYAARFLSGASQVYGPRQPTPVVNLFGIEGLLGETFGTDLYRVAGYGKDTGIRTEQDVQRVTSNLQAVMKPEEWNSVKFLFSNDAASRARIFHLRSKIAERSAGHYENLAKVQEAALNVLASEGVDLRTLSERSAIALFSSPEVDTNPAKVERDYKNLKTGLRVLFDLSLQVFPDDVPVYRGVEAAYMGAANPFGVSYWGVGESGLGVAREYRNSGEPQDMRIIKTTLGELRSRGVLKTDRIAATGNAVEFFHGPDGLGGAAVVPYRVVE